MGWGESKKSYSQGGAKKKKAIILAKKKGQMVVEKMKVLFFNAKASRNLFKRYKISTYYRFSGDLVQFFVLMCSLLVRHLKNVSQRKFLFLSSKISANYANR